MGQYFDIDCTPEAKNLEYSKQLSDIFGPTFLTWEKPKTNFYKGLCYQHGHQRAIWIWNEDRVL